MMTGVSSALKGIGGQYELNRLVGAFGGIAYIVGAVGLTAFDVIQRGRQFDIIAFCAAFPAGLAVVVGAIAGAVAWKDRGVATAKVISETGAIPVAPPDGPAVPVGEVK